MSRIPVTVILQDEGAQRQARDVLGRFANYRAVMRGPVRDLMQKAVRLQFETEGEFSGERWQELAPRTLDDKAKHPEWRQEILRRTDRLYDSLTSVTEDTDEEITATSYAFGTLVPWGRYHQSTEPRTKIPRRPFIPDELPQPYIVKLKNILAGYIVEGRTA